MFLKLLFFLCFLCLIQQSTSVTCYSCRENGTRSNCYYVSNITSPRQECFYGCYLYQYTVTKETAPTYTLSLKKGIKKTTKKTNTVFTERSCEPPKESQCANPSFPITEGTKVTFRRNHCVTCNEDLCNISTRAGFPFFTLALSLLLFH